MAAGLQVWGDDNQLQIDGSSVHVTYRRYGSAQAVYQPATNAYWKAAAPVVLAADEVAVWRPQAGLWGAGIPGVTGGGINSISFMGEAQGMWFDYWVFGPHQASGLNYGMQVFGDDGTLIYDTGRAMMNVTDIHQGTGGPLYYPGTFGLITQAMYSETAAGPPPGPGVFFYRSTVGGVIWDGGSGLTSENRVVYQIGNPAQQNGSVNNNTDNSFIVVGLDNL